MKPRCQEPSSPFASVEDAVELTLDVDAGTLKKIDRFIALQADPKPDRFEAVRQLVALGLDADRDARRAKKEAAAHLKQAEADIARSDYALSQTLQDENTARLRALRLAKEARDSAAAGVISPLRPSPRRSERAR